MCFLQMESEKANDPINVESENENENLAERIDEDEQNDEVVKRFPGKRSYVWNHYTYVEGSNKTKVKCDYCPTIIAAAGKKNGTSAMKYHLENVCSRSPHYHKAKKQDMKKQSILSFKPSAMGGSGLAPHSFKQEYARKCLALMCIIDNQPFSIVDDEGLRQFAWSLNPLFKFPSRWTIARECLSIYTEEKSKLKKLFQNQMVSLTTDTWTSVQNFNYMCLTAHWIDENWILRKKILNFCQISNHRG